MDFKLEYMKTTDLEKPVGKEGIFGNVFSNENAGENKIFSLIEIHFDIHRSKFNLTHKEGLRARNNQL
ncbi:hypothetical protein ABEO47_12575 [Heyndrickxia faecalis]|uniref:hypothetical protein n=1 Tax=Heyndrickxia faecalis TaxID=2824910 RepID=UPI003D237637